MSGVITTIEKGHVSVLLNQNAGVQSLSDTEVSLAVSVIKPERMDLLVQKASELGMHSLFPLITERCVVRISRERWASKAERWRKIALEACKQCGRSSAPIIHDVQDIKLFLEKAPKHYDLSLIPTLAKQGKGLYDILRSAKPKKVLIWIGPEGDFTLKEVDGALAKGAEPVSLGPLVMRSETAAWYALSVVQFMLREVTGV